MDRRGWCFCLHEAAPHVYDRDALAITRRGIAVAMHHRRPPLPPGELASLEKC